MPLHFVPGSNHLSFYSSRVSGVIDTPLFEQVHKYLQQKGHGIPFSWHNGQARGPAPTVGGYASSA